MRVETGIGLYYKSPVKALLASPRFVAAAQDDGFSSGIEGEGETPSAASNLSSFMFVYREPFSVSTRGLPRAGPNCSSNFAWARSSS